LKKPLLLAGLALTGLLATAAPALAAAAPALAATAPLAAAAAPAAAPAANFGYYDNQPIEYEATAEVTSSPQQAQVLAHGNIVFHIVDPAGTVPAVQLARAQAAFPNDAGAGNVLNFIPTETGYTGGAWNLQIFHWNPGVTPTELSSDTDILAAVAAGQGTLEITSTLVRCPVINFSALR
jgi:hypothetical protein